MAPNAPLRWFGSETCRHCLQSFHVALERRCFDCDGPVCVFCIETRTVRGTLHCPGCATPPAQRRARALAGAVRRKRP